MKTGLTIVAFAFLLIMLPLTSAEIILNQPGELFNLGDPLSIPVTIKTASEINGFFSVNLICSGKETEIYKEYIFLLAGEEKRMSPKIRLLPSLTGITASSCKIKAILNDEYVLTNDFKISKKINVALKTEQTEYSPGEMIIIEGDAIKENGQPAEGFIEITSSISALPVSENPVEKEGEPTNETESPTQPEPIPTNQAINILDTVTNGYFQVKIQLPKNTKAGQYQIKLKVYEKDFEGFETNTGLSSLSAAVIQVPTSLEVILEKENIIPGESLKVKTILHDQTGEKMPSISTITIKDNKGEIREKIVDHPTDEFFEYPILYNEPPKEWKITATSNDFTSEASFKIQEKQEIKVEILNKTLVITNTGNVHYNKTISVKIGSVTKPLEVNLDVDETQKYKMSAPDGEYEIEVITDGNSKITGLATLTGRSIDVKKSSSEKFSLIRYPLVWIFMILILGFIAFMVVRKGYKRSFIGHLNIGKNKETVKEIHHASKGSLIEKNTAEVSLSLKGDKQPAKITCLKIHNSKDLRKESKEIIKKITDYADKEKAVYYEDGDYIFFIFSPAITKTFKNDTPAIKLGQEAKKILDENNKLAKEKIIYGISLNQGQIIAKRENHEHFLKFMSLGNLIGLSKKIASISNGEINLTPEFNSQLMSGVKTEKQKKGDVEFFSIKEFRGIRDSEENKKFISGFVDRLKKG